MRLFNVALLLPLLGNAAPTTFEDVFDELFGTGAFNLDDGIPADPANNINIENVGAQATEHPWPVESPTSTLPQVTASQPTPNSQPVQQVPSNTQPQGNAAQAAAGAQTLIPSTCFDSTADLEKYFNYNYPWGTTHNGAAQMSPAYVTLDASVMTITAVHTGASPFAYNSGALFAKQHFTVAKGTTLTFQGKFKAPVVLGSWPAFWLTAVVGWPPEIDMAEWKGHGDIWFNTFNTSSIVSADPTPYPNPDQFHDVKCVVSDENGVDAKVVFYLDGNLVTTQVGKGFVGAAFWLIINMQMEGGSGSPGPTSNTTYSVSDLLITSSSAAT